MWLLFYPFLNTFCSNDSRAFHASLLGLHWTIKSIPTILVPHLIFKTGAQKQEQTCTERQGRVCTENIFGPWGGGCDVTQMAKTSSTFGLKTLWWKIFYGWVPPWKKLVHIRHSGGGIPQQDPQLQRDSCTNGTGNSTDEAEFNHPWTSPSPFWRLMWGFCFTIILTFHCIELSWTCLAPGGLNESIIQWPHSPSGVFSHKVLELQHC